MWYLERSAAPHQCLSETMRLKQCPVEFELASCVTEEADQLRQTLEMLDATDEETIGAAIDGLHRLESLKRLLAFARERAEMFREHARVTLEDAQRHAKAFRARVERDPSDDEATAGIMHWEKHAEACSRSLLAWSRVNDSEV
jgi:hypothetical protein